MAAVPTGLYTERKLFPPEAPYGIAGVVAGLTLNEFFAEWAARVSGQTGWGRVGVKGFVKLLIALAFWYLGRQVAAPLTRLFCHVVGYTTAGTILWDVFYELYPGGIWGAATAAAYMARRTAPAAAAIRMAMPRAALKITPSVIEAAPPATPRVTAVTPTPSTATRGL